MAGLAFVLVGCTDNSVPFDTPTSVGDNTAASLMKTSGSGAWIVRDEYANAWFWGIDDNSGLLIVLARDLSEACTGLGGWEVIDFKHIYLPSAGQEPRRIVQQIKSGDVSASVWDADLFTGSLCALFRNYEPIAVGTANLVGTDNDLFADGDNHNAAGWKANGTLFGLDGRAYKLNFIVHVVWDGVDMAGSKTILKVQLTPTGGK